MLTRCNIVSVVFCLQQEAISDAKCKGEVCSSAMFQLVSYLLRQCTPSGVYGASCLSRGQQSWRYSRPRPSLHCSYIDRQWSALMPVFLHHSGTAAAAPLPFRPGSPALCGSCPLVTPYYCRLCYNCMLYLSYHFVCMHVYFVFSLFFGLFSFVDFPSVLWYCWLGLLTCKNRLPYNLYCVGGDVKHCAIQSNFLHHAV